MVTLTFNIYGLVLASSAILAGLMIPTSIDNGDTMSGIVWTIITIIVTVVVYMTGVGISTMFGS